MSSKGRKEKTLSLFDSCDDDDSSIASKNSIMSKLSNIIEYIPDVALRNKSKTSARKLRSEYLRIRTDNVILQEENNVSLKTISVLQSNLEKLKNRFTHLTTSHQTLKSEYSSLRLEQFQSKTKVQEQKQSEQQLLLNAETLAEYGAIIRYNQQRDKDLLLHIVTSIHKLELLTADNAATVVAQLKSQLLDVRDKLLPSKNSHSSSSSSSSSAKTSLSYSTSSNQLLKPTAAFYPIPSTKEGAKAQASPSTSTQHPTLVLGTSTNDKKKSTTSKLSISTSSNDIKMAPPTTTVNFKRSHSASFSPSVGAFAPLPVLSGTVQSAPSPRSMLGIQAATMSYDLHTGYPFSISNITSSSTSNIGTDSGMTLNTQPPSSDMDDTGNIGTSNAGEVRETQSDTERRTKKKNKRGRDGADWY